MIDTSYNGCIYVFKSGRNNDIYRQSEEHQKSSCFLFYDRSAPAIPYPDDGQECTGYYLDRRRKRSGCFFTGKYTDQKTLTAVQRHAQGRQVVQLYLYQKRTIPASFFHPDRKSTRLNSSHVAISYAVF